MKNFNEIFKGLEDLKHRSPIYDSFSDYNTNSKSYYDYLARVNQYLKLIEKVMNHLIDRSIEFEDTNTIDFTKITDWIENDLVTVSADVNLSKKIQKQMIGYVEYQCKNAIVKKTDGLHSPDFTQVLKDLQQKINDLEFVNDKDFVFFKDGKVRDKINYNQDLLPNNVDLSSTNEEVDKAYKDLQDTDIYKVFDELQKENKKYSQMYVWGYTEDGRPLKYYVFEARNKWNVPVGSKGISRFEDYNNQKESFPLFFATSAQHGNEKANTWALYLSIRDIVNGSSDIDRYIRDNYDLVILPMCNPYGFNHNLRNNENDVNINRNYPYKWKEDTSTDKGSEPLSEKSAQFINEVRNAYSDDKFKNGACLIDFHDFNDTHYDDGRFLWVGSNDKNFRESEIKTANNIYDLLTKKSPLIRDNIQDGWNHLGATGVGYGSTLNAYNFDSGYKSISCEVPTQIDYLDKDCRFTTTTGLIAYTIVKSFIINSILDISGVVKQNLIGFNDITTNRNNTLYEIATSIPNGATFTLGVFDDVETIEEGEENDNLTYKYMNDLPKNRYGTLKKGILNIYRSSYYNSSSGYMTYVTMGDSKEEKPELYINSFSLGSLRQWKNLDNNVKTSINELNLKLPEKTLTLNDLITNLENGQELNLYVTSKFIELKKDLPDGEYKSGFLKIIKLGSNNSQIEFTIHNNDLFQKFLNFTNSNGLHDWKGVLINE